MVTDSFRVFQSVAISVYPRYGSLCPNHSHRSSPVDERLRGEDVLYLAQQCARLGLVLQGQSAFEFLQQFALPFAELARGLHLHLNVEVALAAAVQRGHTL